jgi:hypothetical protein
MLGQREGKMIGDKVHAIKMRIMDLERLHNRAVTVEERHRYTEKIKCLETLCKQLRCNYKTISSGITSILSGLIQAVIPPPAPLGITHLNMPPPPQPPTPTSPHNTHLPITPITTPSNNSKGTDSTEDNTSLAKRQQVTVSELHGYG